jgi:hypothetical protein
MDPLFERAEKAIQESHAIWRQARRSLLQAKVTASLLTDAVHRTAAEVRNSPHSGKADAVCSEEESQAERTA